jgi:hypothetical protein
LSGWALEEQAARSVDIRTRQIQTAFDEALFFSAEIYNKKLVDLEKAKSYYEKLVFHHQDSIYFVEARKKYRELRGDLAP